MLLKFPNLLRLDWNIWNDKKFTLETHLLNFRRHPVLKRGGATFNSSAPDKELKGCTAATGRAGISSFDDLEGPRYKVKGFQRFVGFRGFLRNFFKEGGECEIGRAWGWMNLLFQQRPLKLGNWARNSQDDWGHLEALQSPLSGLTNGWLQWFFDQNHHRIWKICTNFNNSYLVYLVVQLGSASLAPRLVKSGFKLTTLSPTTPCFFVKSCFALVVPSHPVLWKRLRPPASGAANPLEQLDKLFFNLQLRTFAMALCAAGKAPEKLSACSQECLER